MKFSTVNQFVEDLYSDEFEGNGCKELSERATQCVQQAYASQSDAVAPPILLGGVNSQIIEHCNKMDVKGRDRSIGIDWIQGTIPNELSMAFTKYMSDIVGHRPESRSYGFSGYQASCVWHPFGIKFAWDNDDENKAIHGGRCLISLSGSSLNCFNAESLYQFCRDLCNKFYFKASRVDLCFDDYEKIVRPDEVREIAKAGFYQGFRLFKYYDGSSRKGERTNEGISFGTRGKNGGGKFLRCYAKDIESEGEIDSIRWEVEFSKAKANAVFFKIAMSLDLEEFATNIAMFIGGAIDFIERRGKRCDPADRLAFWEQILDCLGSAKLKSATPEKSIWTTKQWAEKSVFPSMAKIRKAIGNDLYYAWINEQMEDVVLSFAAECQIKSYQNVHGVPIEEEVPF